MSESYPTDYRWRTAAKFDIGSIARFRDFEGGPLSFGLLVEMNKDQDGQWYYVCDFTKQNKFLPRQLVRFAECHIQYDANKEP